MGYTDTTYNRLLKSALCEEILSTFDIHLNVHYLNTIINKKRLAGTMDKNSELYRYYKYAINNNRKIKTEYYSRNKTTFRMFTKKGHLNLITLADKIILTAISSRTGGYIAEIDYKAFEYTIICSLLNIPNAPEDLHTEAQGWLTWLNRDEVKRVNNAILYGGNIEAYISELKDHPDCEDEMVDGYISLIVPFVVKRDSFIEDHEHMYNSHGYVINSYGRKIYPTSNKNIFNNIIQSIGSEILIDLIIEFNTKLSDVDGINVLFHRFDSIFFDLSKENIKENLLYINNIMKSINGDINLQTNISVGKNLTSMKRVT